MLAECQQVISVPTEKGKTMNKREKLIELLENFSTPIVAPNGVILMDWTVPTSQIRHELADHLIANDVVPVVRCKDCKHFIQEEHGCNHFGYYSHTPWVDEVDFCSYGERKDNDN